MKQFRFERFKDFYAYHAQVEQDRAVNKKSDTLEKLARKMGYKSPSLFSMIASGKRLPSAALLDALLEKWQIPQNERESIRVQVEIERRLKNNRDVLPLVDRLRKLAGQAEYLKLNFDQFEVIRHWYIYVIKELIGTKRFTEDALTLSRVLRGKVSPTEIQKGVQALLNVGLVRRNPQTHHLESTVEDTETSNGVPSEAIRQHHRSMLERAIEAISEQPVENRHYNALTFRFDPKKLEALRSKLFEFIKQINQDFQAKDSDRIYQLNIQFFEHTKEVEKRGEV